MRRRHLAVLAQLVVGFGLVLGSSADWTRGADRLSPVDKVLQAARADRVTLCHRRPDGRYSPRTMALSGVPDHLAHGDCLIDDGIDCTSDSCNETRGCVHVRNDSRCNDNVACTVDTCSTSSGCQNTPDHGSCADGDACTADTCNPGSGCENDPITPCCGNRSTEAGEECDDGNTTPGDGCDENCQSEAPANNDCDNAEPISNGTTPFDNTGATSDGTAVCGIGSDIWYHYTAPCTGTVTIDTIGSGFDTILAAYDGCSCPVAPFLVCNDDAAGGFQSLIAVAIVEGNCYRIQVGGYAGAQGSGVINIDSTCCGDGTCDPSEDDGNCPADCGCAAGTCGGSGPSGCSCDCECDERDDCCADRLSVCDLSNCPYCGDGICNGDENECFCETDCGGGCGDGECNCFEDIGNCPEDCGCGAPGACGGQAPSGCSCDCDCAENDECCPDAASACSFSTTCPFCGDGTCDPGEYDCFGFCEADCGPDYCGDGNCRCFEDEFNCPSDCVVCGDWNIDPGEECDDGNTTPGDGCSAVCRFEACGNGALDPGEECDDGNTTQGDGCDAACQDECAVPQQSCTQATDCCEGGVTTLCASFQCCSTLGSPCSLDGDCCGLGSLICTNNVCALPCRDLQENCTTAADCCDAGAECSTTNNFCGPTTSGIPSVCCVPRGGACQEDCECCGLSICTGNVCEED